MDFKSLPIDQSKISADGDAYFALFDKHIPRNLGNGSTMLLYELANMSCIMKIIALNPDAKYIVIGNEFVNDALKLMVDTHIDVEYKEEIDLEACDMKFDCIIQNPPYSRNLHLKILAEAIKHLKDDGICVNLAPSPYTKYKNTNNFKLLPYLYEKIDPNDAAKLFSGIQLQDSLLVSVWHKTKHISLEQIKNDFVPKAYSIIKRLNFQTTFASVNKLNYNNEDFFVPLKLMTARWDKNKNDIIDKIGLISFGKVENGKPFKAVRTKNVDRPCGGIPFNTKIEAINFINSCRTTFFKFVVYMQHTNSRYVLHDYPFMQDYTKPWTNERFYKFFNITPEEQKIIEDTMKQYDSK